MESKSSTRTYSRAMILAYARLVKRGVRTIDEIPEACKVQVYIVLIAEKHIALEGVPEPYLSEVKAELGIKEEKADDPLDDGGEPGGL